MVTMKRIVRKGDRVRVVSSHKWMPERYGTIKQVENRIGNRFLVKFDREELGMWHDDDGDPVLRLGDDDLAFIEGSVSIAA
ncbi:MAG: hypothetical protein ACREQA_01730 [Candidatus Binatia bacterium]